MDKYAISAIIISVIVVLGLVGLYGNDKGWFGDEEAPDAGATAPAPIIVVSPGAIAPAGAVGYVPPTAQVPVSGDKVPVESLSAAAKDKFTMATVTDGDFRFYFPGADISDPYVQNLDNLDIGTGSTTNLIIQTGTSYDLVYESDGATYYDELILSWTINYNPETGNGYLLIGGKSYYPVTAVGTITPVTTLAEVQSGANESSGTLYYDESSLGGSMWWKMDIGNNNANTEIQRMVLCFRDADGDMEGNEVTSITATYDSGTTAIVIPGTLQQYFEDAMGGGSAQCIDIAAVLGSSQKARWTFTTTVVEANFDTDEEFEITFDDLGDYLEKQYPSRSSKATAVSLVIGNQA